MSVNELPGITGEPIPEQQEQNLKRYYCVFNSLEVFTYPVEAIALMITGVMVEAINDADLTAKLIALVPNSTIEEWKVTLLDE